MVNKKIRRGYKSMPEHVNMMDKSMKHKVVIDHIGDEYIAIIRDFLKNHDIEMWNHSSDELKEALHDK